MIRYDKDGKVDRTGWNRSDRVMCTAYADALDRAHADTRKVADDIERWFGDGLRPDEWKLKEWADTLRQALRANGCEVKP